jgi:uncharacterized protein YjeT (DUF2065 family)
MVVEGILPFVAPGRWKEAVQSLVQLDDGQLRAIGLGSMVVGLALLAWVRA